MNLSIDKKKKNQIRINRYLFDLSSPDKSEQLGNLNFSNQGRFPKPGQHDILNLQATMARYLSATVAASLDRELMSSGAYSLDQLMELAGLSVSQVIYYVCPPSQGKKVFVLVGPGNNGGDGLVAARHLVQYGYEPQIYYPKKSKGELFQRLERQLLNLNVSFVDQLHPYIDQADHVIDAIFGFGFKGNVREPFNDAIIAMKELSQKAPHVHITSVDVPSSWDVDTGPPSSGPGVGFMPNTLISLTAPKPCAKLFPGRHFVGGRFLYDDIYEKYNLERFSYQGVDQIVELTSKL